MGYSTWPHQDKLINSCFDSWGAGCRHNLIVSPTGTGKTVIGGSIIERFDAPSVSIAHRQELVSQISKALAVQGIRHRIIAPKNVIKLCVSIHMDEMGKSYYDPNSIHGVAGVDTVIRRELGGWADRVKLWWMDEAHHVLRGNKWGKAVAMFKNANGFGVTATPLRADGYGLGAHADGVFEDMHVGLNMRDVIDSGFLTDYRVICPLSDIDVSNVNISQQTGDFNKEQLKTAVRKSHVVGDIVRSYLEFAPNKLGVTFVTDVETANLVADRFNLSGVPAAVVHAGTPDKDRVALLNRFRRRELLQLVNVDLFGEGYDLPALEVVSFARHTASYALYVQQFGRVLRLMIDSGHRRRWGSYSDAQRLHIIANSDKPKGIILDHVGNVVRHLLPDYGKQWTLDRTVKKQQGDDSDIPMRVCANPECLAAYFRTKPVCPYCEVRPEYQDRSAPEFVDGDLVELSPEALQRLRGGIQKVDMSAEEYRVMQSLKNTPRAWVEKNIKDRSKVQLAQAYLRETMAMWAGVKSHLGVSDSESYRTFYHKFGIDVLSAQTLKPDESYNLMEKINNDLNRMGY